MKDDDTSIKDRTTIVKGFQALIEWTQKKIDNNSYLYYTLITELVS